MGKKKDISTLVSTQDRLNIWEMRMLRLASSSIKWEGLPESIDKVWLEYLLCRNGSAIIVYEEMLDSYFVGQNASTGTLDIYGYPMNRAVIFRNGQQAFYSPETSVIIYNNSMRSGDFWMYRIFANDLANIDMAVRVNINSQKTMPIIPSSQEQALSMKNLYRDIEENEGVKIVDSTGLDLEGFKAAIQFDNRKSFTSDNMISVQREIWNRCLTLIGINNVNVEKRERVNTFETNSNLDEIAIMRRDKLNARDEASKIMRNLWGFEAKAEYYSDLKNTIGGDGNGGVYDTSTNDTGTVLD